MRYLVCRLRRHDAVAHSSGCWRWFACLDCRKQWNSWGDLLSDLLGGWFDARPLSRDDAFQVKAELAGVELPPLWRHTRRSEQW